MLKSTLNSCKLVVKPSSISGYGVFAQEDIHEEAIIEECHALLFKDDHNLLLNYSFSFTDKEIILPLGFGCIYNHSDKPNAYFYYDEKDAIFVFRSIKRIKKEEEILISYGKNWLDTRKIVLKKPSMLYKIRRMLSTPLFRVVLITLMIYAIAYMPKINGINAIF